MSPLHTHAVNHPTIVHRTLPRCRGSRSLSPMLCRFPIHPRTHHHPHEWICPVRWPCSPASTPRIGHHQAKLVHRSPISSALSTHHHTRCHSYSKTVIFSPLGLLPWVLALVCWIWSIVSHFWTHLVGWVNNWVRLGWVGDLLCVSLGGLPPRGGFSFLANITFVTHMYNI